MVKLPPEIEIKSFTIYSLYIILKRFDGVFFTFLFVVDNRQLCYIITTITIIVYRHRAITHLNVSL